MLIILLKKGLNLTIFNLSLLSNILFKADIIVVLPDPSAPVITKILPSLDLILLESPNNFVNFLIIVYLIELFITLILDAIRNCSNSLDISLIWIISVRDGNSNSPKVGFNSLKLLKRKI